MEEVNKWFSKAIEDLDTAKFNLDGKRIDAGLFYLQQSAEKALKSLYIKKFKEVIKIHDLVILGKKIEAPDNIIYYCKILTPAYQYTRYPDAIAKLDISENRIQEFVKSSEEILKWVKKNL